MCYARCGALSLMAGAIGLLFQPTVCPAELHGDAELLRAVAMRQKSNWQSIVTWTGDVIEKRASRPGGRRFEIHNTAQFVFDRARQAARWNKETVECRVDGKQADLLVFAGRRASMIRDGHGFDYRPCGRDNGNVTRRLSISPAAAGMGPGRESLDPAYFFSDPQGGEPLHVRLMGLYKLAKDPKLGDWHISRKGDIVTLEVEFEHNGPNVNKYVFDLSQGANLIRYINTNPRVTNEYAYEYERHGEVWVLQSYKHANRDSRKKGVSVRSVKWINSVVNEPVAEDEFAIEKLGIKPGEQVHDMKTGLVYTYAATGQHGWRLPGNIEEAHAPTTPVGRDHPAEPEAAGPRPVPDTAGPATSASDGNGSSSYLLLVCLVAGIAVLLAGFAYGIARRRRRA